MTENGNSALGKSRAKAPAENGHYPMMKQPIVKSLLAARQVTPQQNWLYTEPILEVDDIQGDALLGFNKPYLSILAIDIKKESTMNTTTDFKRWLSEYVIPSVTSARDVIRFRDIFRLMREKRGGVKPTTLAQVCFNVSFSYDALLLLAPKSDVEKFYKPGVNVAFKIGLAPRSTYLQDPTSGIGAQSNWKVGAEKNPHVLIQIASDREFMIKEEIDKLKAGLVACGSPASIKYEECGKRLVDHPGHEHFGFLDGISNPGLRGRYTPDRFDKPLYITPRYLDSEDPRVDLYGLPGQHLLWAGEIILGENKQYTDTSSGDPVVINKPGSDSFIGPSWAKNGTYLVYRRLRQDVVKFWDFLTKNAAEIAKDQEMENFTNHHLGAKVVSRWKSGTPILRSTSEDNVNLGVDKTANNAFQYQTKLVPFALKPDGDTDGFTQGAADPLGKICPLSAHLRKIQPRDSSTDIGSKDDTLKRLIIRRGIQYGDPIADVTVDDEVDRGLMFVCYQASIDDQFEFLVTHWANSDASPNNGGGHDMIIGQTNAAGRERHIDVALSNGTMKQLKTKDEWVIPTGGGYFFVPSISALKDVLAK